MASFWLEESAEPIPSRALAGNPEVEIVGGGVTGCACALALAERGLRVRLHEAREVAGGASGRNGGFALRGGAMAYDVAKRHLGDDRARSYWELTEHALDDMAGLAGDSLRRVGSLRLAVDVDERESLRAEFDALVADGFEARWIDGADLETPLRGRFAAGLEHPRDGALQPARWVRRLAALAAGAGAEIRQQSRVESLDDLVAEHVVVATDGYTRGLVPELDRRIQPTRGQVIVTEALPKLLFAKPHYSRHGFDYWHQTSDRRLVIGGHRDASPATETTAVEDLTSVVQEKIEAFARELVGRPPRVTHRWAGIWGTTEDLLPLVGKLPDGDGRVWVAAGYSGHGNVLGFACGRMLADAIAGESHPLLEVLDPTRFG